MTFELVGMPTPLEDVTIADFSQMTQGGWATMKLADMDADVLKVEPPWGDLGRTSEPNGKQLDGVSPWFLSTNRNKRSIALDLKSDQGREIALDIVEDADMLFENFRPGVMEKFGLGYEDVREVSPDIVYVSGYGYESSGPYVDRPGQDLLVQAVSGVAANTGRREDPPTPAGAFICNVYSAMTLALHAMIALHQKQRTGEGQKVESSLLNAGIDMQSSEFTTALNMDIEVERSEAGIGHSMSSAPYGIYETWDGHIAISFGQLPTLADELDVETVCDYESDAETFEHRDEIKRLTEERTRERPTDDLIEQLSDAGVWVSDVNDYHEAAGDAQVRHNDMIVEHDHPHGGTFETTGVPVSMSAVEPEFDGPPRLGQHSEEILAELGFDADEIEALAADDVITSA